MDAQSSQKPVVCTLTDTQAHDQLAAWSDLGPSLTRLELHDRGVVLWFDTDAEAADAPDGVPIVHLLAEQVSGSAA
jgi:hypothetical protein